MTKIKINTINDYDNYFTDWATLLANKLEQKPNNKITQIDVNSGPYRSYGMSYDVDNTTLKLDFYSAVRTGFGSIGTTTDELADILCKE